MIPLKTLYNMISITTFFPIVLPGFEPKTSILPLHHIMAHILLYFIFKSLLFKSLHSALTQIRYLFSGLSNHYFLFHIVATSLLIPITAFITSHSIPFCLYTIFLKYFFLSKNCLDPTIK